MNSTLIVIFYSWLVYYSLLAASLLLLKQHSVNLALGTLHNKNISLAYKKVAYGVEKLFFPFFKFPTQFELLFFMVWTFD